MEVKVGIGRVIQLTYFFASVIVDIPLERIRAAKERREREAQKIQKQQERDARIVGTPCSHCRKIITAGYLNDLVRPWLHYCSAECFLGALDKDEKDLEQRRNRAPSAISLSDAPLLIGKSSGGMYFESGRCAKCGQALGNQVAFGFCSEICENKAYAPHRTFTDELADDPYYQLASKGHAELADEGMGNYLEIDRENKQMPPEKLAEKIDTQKYFAAKQHDRKVQDDIIRARNAFMANWEKQREYILERERPKEEERSRREQEKEGAELAKHFEAILEDERWKPKRFEA
jgi:ferredoxin